VLVGHATDKVTRNRHDKVSVFGIGAERSANAWRSVIRQLVVQGYLRVDQERYGALVLTETSRPVLRGEVEVRLREDPKEPAARKKPKVPTAAETLSAEDRELFERLRELRKKFAAEQGVPPYVIFHDATLVEMALTKPGSPEAMLELSGVGRTKLERYGARFLEEVS
jgi:ATP-dependent DNA helicase RecQ